MSANKRISGDYNIETISGNVAITSDVIISGNLTVSGAQTEVTSTNTNITDRVITLNDGELGAGVTGVRSGIEVDRGTSTNARFVYDEATDAWQLDDGSGSLVPVVQSVTGLTEVVDDTSPQLGGDLDVNGNKIGQASADVTILAEEVNLDADAVRILNNPGTPSSEAGYNKLYAATPASGGTGLFVTNSTATEELVSKSKAIVFGIIF
jgi:phage baseplate assembly protein gpV